MSAGEPTMEPQHSCGETSKGCSNAATKSLRLEFASCLVKPPGRTQHKQNNLPPIRRTDCDPSLQLCRLAGGSHCPSIWGRRNIFFDAFQRLLLANQTNRPNSTKDQYLSCTRFDCPLPGRAFHAQR